MEININRFVVIKNEKTHNLVQLRKTFSKDDLFCIPRVGDTWEESFVLDEAAAVEQVVFNYDKKECNVFLTNLQLNEKTLERTIFAKSINTLKGRGWTVDNIEPALELLK